MQLDFLFIFKNNMFQGYMNLMNARRNNQLVICGQALELSEQNMEYTCNNYVSYARLPAVSPRGHRKTETI